MSKKVGLTDITKGELQTRSPLWVKFKGYSAGVYQNTSKPVPRSKMLQLGMRQLKRYVKKR